MKPNLAAIREYYKKEAEYLSRVAELDAITSQRDQIRAEYEVTSHLAPISRDMLISASNPV
jgi:hypothetical protein